MRNIRKKFSRPRMIWDTKLIEEDKAILREFGLRRKQEIWKTKEVVRDFRRRARELNASRDKNKEKVLIEKINRLGLINANSLDDVLSIDIKNILERRLQTIVFKKGLAKTMKQARQLITHGHISIDGRRTTFPSYIVPLSEEPQINFYGNFTLKEPEKVEVKKEVAQQSGAPEVEQQAGEPKQEEQKPVEVAAEA